MPSLLRSIRESLREPSAELERSAPMSLDDYAAAMSGVLDEFNMGSSSPLTQTWRNEPAERIGTSMTALAQQAYSSNGLAFSVMAVRMVAFSLMRFSWQRLRNGRPDSLFGNPSLLPLENPWPGGSTQDLLQRMILDADLAGNAYVVRDGTYMMRLRPDWVQILLAPVFRNGGFVGYRKVGYTFHDGGIETCPPDKVALFAVNEVAHFAPTPDPNATFRGMSWLNPVISELRNDKQMERHKTRFFENAATPNLSVSLAKEVSSDDFRKFKAIMDEEHVGVDNAYKTLYLGGGADVKVIGANFQQLEMNELQGRGETRVAAAGGVPAIIVGLSEGLNSATYSNYGQAMRRFADLTMTHLWGSAAGALSVLMTSPGPDARLWFDTRDVAFLREDRKASAEIEQINAATIVQLVNGGFTWESAVLAVDAQDMTLLVHTGLVSVQLQPPGVQAGGDGAAEPGADGAPAGDPAADPAADLNGKTPAEIRLLMEMIQKVYLGIGKVLTTQEARDLLNRAGAELPELPDDHPLLAGTEPSPGADPGPDAPADDPEPPPDDDDPVPEPATNATPPPPRRRALPPVPATLTLDPTGAIDSVDRQLMSDDQHPAYPTNGVRP